MKREKSLFDDLDPVGTIICEDNLAFCDDKKAIPFVEALTKVGYTGHWGYLLPPEGDFIDMRSVVDQSIIDEMIDNGIYPSQKMPE